MSSQATSIAQQKPVIGSWGVRYKVADVGRSTDFYTRHLGFQVDHQNLPVSCQVSSGSLRVILSGPDAVPETMPFSNGREKWLSPDSSGLVLEVEDIAGHVDLLKRSGLCFQSGIQTGTSGRRIDLEDLDGNPIVLLERP